MPVDYKAPTRDMRFALEELVPCAEISALPGFEEYSPDLTEAVLEEAGKFATGVLSPLNIVGDAQGAQRQPNATVKTADGFKQAYQQFVEGGWNGLSGTPEYGGQGLPEVLATSVNEMWQSACMSFALCPMLTAGAIHAIEMNGSKALQDMVVGKMVEGQWAGTMNLTEPQAGSDLAAVTTKAIPEGDAYRITGTKIYITYGDHDFTENIIHLVLARLPDAPPGVKGISLFMVPKILINADGSLGAPNDVTCVSLEHKLGIHASPTAVMGYGEKGGALGYLVGEPNRGLEYMFVMMNHARLNVGVQGVSIAERAYQQAHWYAYDRVQGRVVGRPEPKLAIAFHPDVRRMLGSMKSRVEAMRALSYEAAAYLDISGRHPDAEQRKLAQARVDLLIPVVKAWCTEEAQDICGLGIQVHGGMGFIEETGAAQHYRDARIITIYEGTTAIQANDFIGRKLARDQGAELMRLLGEMDATIADLRASANPALKTLGEQLASGRAALAEGATWTLKNFKDQMGGAFMSSVPLLLLAGKVMGGWMMGRAALIAEGKKASEPFYAQKVASACFYGSHVLAPAAGMVHTVTAGVSSLAEAEAFTAEA